MPEGRSRLVLALGLGLALATGSMAGERASLPSSGNKAGPYRYRTLTPCRVFDTRVSGSQTFGAPLWNPGPHGFRIQGTCGVPEGAVAVSANITITQPTQAGDLRLFPSGGAPPLVSTLNFASGEAALANGAILPLGPSSSGSDDLEIQIGMMSHGTVHVFMDVSGYFQ